MEKKYVIKHFNTGQYWTYNSEYGEASEAQTFQTVEEAENMVDLQPYGVFVIETIYTI
jgi:hypothetical protein